MIYTSLLPVLTSAVGSDTPSSPALAGDIGPLAAEKKLEVQGESEGAEGRLVVLEDPVPIDEIVKRVKRNLGLDMRAYSP